MANHSLNKSQLVNNSQITNKILEMLQSGEFPIECCPLHMQQVARYYYDQFHYPLAATSMAMLTLLSAAIGPFARVKNGSEHGQLSLNIWTVIVADRSSGKSHLFSNLGKVFTEEGKKIMEEFRENIQPNIEAELDILRTKLKQLQNKNFDGGVIKSELVDIKKEIKRLESIHPLEIRFGTATSEALKKHVADTPDHFMFSMLAEGGEMFRIMFGKYNNRNQSEFDAWLSLKTGEYINDTRLCRENVTAYYGSLAILWAVQPVVAEEILSNREALLRGLFTRMFIFDPGFKQQKAQRKYIPPVDLSKFNDLICYFINGRKNIVNDWISQNDGRSIEEYIEAAMVKIRCADDARECFADFHDYSVECGERMAVFDPAMAGECGRWREDAITIAGLLACAERKPEVDVDLAKRAIKIVKWLKKNYLSLLLSKHIGQIQEKYERLLDLIDSSPGKCVTVRQLYNNHGISKQDIASMNVSYPDTFIVEMTNNPNGGRPSQIIQLKHAR
jgi:hypothetical protein